MAKFILGVIAGCGMIASAAAMAGQTQPTTPTASVEPASKYSGCVMRLEADKDTLVINDATVCAKLTGKFVAADIAGHEVDITGVLKAGSRTIPASLNVSSVGSVGKSCSSICSLLPPRTRGLGKGGEVPGKEGGTPGVAPQH
ncbi:MAG TPA: hypothetical protein VGN01_10460 [Acidobacteriaceae bacterium]